MIPFMKNNMVKTIGLIALLGLLLFIGRRMDQAKDEGVKLFDFDRKEVISIALKKARIALKEGGPFLPSIGHPADPEKVDSLIEKLKGLRVVKEIDSEDESEFFSHQNLSIRLETEKGAQTARIGDVSEVTGNFYGQGKNAKGETRIFLLQDISLYEGFYKDELELKLRKYWELKKLLSSSPLELADKRLFRPSIVAKARRVHFDPKINRWFEVDLADKKIRPAPPEGVGTNISPQEVRRLLLNVSFDAFEDNDSSVLEDLLSVIEISADGKNLKAELYGKLNGKSGLFAKLSYSPGRVYFVQEKGREAFFLNAQKFYDKRPKLKVTEELKGLRFSLGPKAGELEKFVLENGQTFEVRGHRGKISKRAQQRFNLVFSVLFAANGFQQAERVRRLGMKEMELALASLQRPVYLEFSGKTFVFSLKGSELFLWDLEERLQFVYKTGDTLKSLAADQFFALEGEEG